MVRVTRPGVYIEEVPSGVHTITGVATSVAAFFGRATRGPIDKAVHLSSMSDYTRQFGPPHPDSDLAYSVRQFFDNGGTECYVVRLAKDPKAAAVTLKNVDRKDVLVAAAKSPGQLGNSVRLEVDYATPNPCDTFNLRVIQEDGGLVVATEEHVGLSMVPTSRRFAPKFVSGASNLINLTLGPDLALGAAAPDNMTYKAGLATGEGYSQSRRPLSGTVAAPPSVANVVMLGTRFEIAVNGKGYVPVDLAGTQVTASDSAHDIETTINAALLAQATAVTCGWFAIDGTHVVLRITSDSGLKASVRIRRVQDEDLAVPLMLGLDQGGIECAAYSQFRPAPSGTALVGDGADLDSFTHVIDTLSGRTDTAVTITATTSAGSESVTVQVAPTAGPWYLKGTNDHDGVRGKLRQIAKAINDKAAFPCTAQLSGYHLALRKRTGVMNDTVSIAWTPDTPPVTTAWVSNVRQYSLGPLGAGSYQTPGQPGDDGGPPELDDYRGSEQDHTGFHALDTVDVFNLVVLPRDHAVDEADALKVWGPASVYCERKRAFLLLDAPTKWTTEGRLNRDEANANDLRATGVVTTHAAVFYPRLCYADGPLVKQIGASGAIAGLMARTDASRGVWKAPAGSEAILKAVLDLEVTLTDPENGLLNQAGICCLRKLPNGLVNWGARTLAGFNDNTDTDWKYIPVRRLALFLEESLFRGTKWVVFEPNDEPLWAKIRLNLNAFMMGLFRQGAFQAITPDKAFFVRCDGRTMTQDDRNKGIVNIEVGFAPLKPAEFLVIRIQQRPGDLA